MSNGRYFCKRGSFIFCSCLFLLFLVIIINQAIMDQLNYGMLQRVPHKMMMAMLNQYIINSTDQINKIAFFAEEEMMKIDEYIEYVENKVMILEAKLASEPNVDKIQINQQPIQQQPPQDNNNNNNGILPPPPNLNDSSNILPPPPSLSSTLSLPPPPSLSSLPPPPSLGSLPPPPSLSLSLPPPPSLSLSLPPPPPPPPSMLLPPPPPPPR